jgi:hypothetical protein
LATDGALILRASADEVRAPGAIGTHANFCQQGAMPPKTDKASNHWPLLDFLRATAALLVLLTHTRFFYFLNVDFADQPNVFLKLFYFITGMGYEAVVIFLC